MTIKIFRSMVLVELVVLIISMSVFLFVLNREFENRTVEELRIQANLAADGILLGGPEYLENMNHNNRTTWISADGSILYDSMGKTDNHGDREEVREALRSGEGTAQRYSETLDGQCIYYAVKLDNGTVLRLSCEKSFVRSMLFTMTIHSVWVLVLMIYGSLALALHVSRRIVKPLESLSLDNLSSEELYPELRPLATRLREQKHTIRDQMDELHARERDFATITENMQEGFLLFDGFGAIMSYNHSGGIILDAVEAERGRLVISEDFAQLQAAVNMALMGQHWEGYQEYNRRVYQCLVNPVVNVGQIMGVVLFMVDATEKQQREQLRREFSANVSHELKTPLTSISGFAELMMNGMIPADKMQECAGDIYKQSSLLINLVGDIIQISNLDEGAAFDVETVNLKDTMLQVKERLEPAAMRKNIDFVLRGQPCTIEGVPHIVEEMLYNLCDNAIKYNLSGGKVTVTWQAGAHTTTISVADTGIGIPLDEQERVFERFYRVNKSHSKEIGGTGLGLSIVKHGAQFHGAEVSMNSAPGRGTTVNITFRNRVGG